MKEIKLYSLFLVLSALFLQSCSDLLDPVDDNHNTLETAYSNPAFAEGLLNLAYSKVPALGNPFNDVATDDAVTNVKTNGYLRMATGSWTSQFNPVSEWQGTNEGIQSINKFIPLIDLVDWKPSEPDMNRMFKDLRKGEAYALRAYLRMVLLQNVGGKSADGQLLGIPLFNEYLDKDANFDIPRSSFQATVDSINADFNRALPYLSMDMKDITSASQLPAKYAGVDISAYNRVFGNVSRQRLTQRIVLGLKARLALMVASPAFSDGNLSCWAQAADASATVLNTIGGIAGLDPKGHKYYVAAQVDAVVTTEQPEMLWREQSSTLSNSIEGNNLPPSLNGKGQVNPSQNLVDAFPMKNGYPITHTSSTFNAANPYANRDPRLALYVLYNGGSIQSKVIKTEVGSGVNAKDSIATSTRTGYYLKKLLREDIVFANNGTAATKKHYDPIIRYTELFLNYAEAANEAWGPTGVGTVGTYSAKDVIAAIRKRAGITQPDAYLNSITTKEAMRELIRNERRLELCFEGFRFWDIRRWGLSLTESAKGVYIVKNAKSYTYMDVEHRVYQPFMQYGPIPYTEIVKFPSLVQNAGW